MIMQLEVTSAQLHRKNYQQAQEVLSQALADARTTLRDARHAITDLRCRTPRVDQLISSVQQEIQMQPKNARKWPKVQKLGITWPEVRILPTGFYPLLTRL